MYKLFNNCIYGKIIENIRKRINVKLVNDKRKYLKIVNTPDFVSQKIIDKNFIAVYCKIILEYTGICILQISKLLMYQFPYDYVLKKLLMLDYCLQTQIL